MRKSRRMYPQKNQSQQPQQQLYGNPSSLALQNNSSAQSQSSRLKIGDMNGGYNNGVDEMRSTPIPALQRRESLVKPTWANISPGQVPPSTLDDLVSSSNNGSSSSSNGAGGNNTASNNVPNTNPNSELGMLSNKLLAKNGSQKQKKREVELYDIFGKVGSDLKR